MGKITKKSRHARIMLWSLAVILCGSMVLPLTGYVYVGLTGTTYAQAQDEETNPRSTFWGAVRKSQSGYVSSQGPYTTNTFIQNGGQNWRQYRNGPVSTYGPWILAVSLLAIGLFHVVTMGGVKLDAQRSGKTVQRWSVFERYLHWFTAILFIVLAITGLSMLFGRAVLIPVMGSAGFAAWAQLALTLHNYLGPFFVVGVLLEILIWMRHNIPNATDLKWFAQGGGLIGKGHPSAGRMNGGEKVWFWIICTFGVAVCVTGLVMDFPNFGFSREDMQLANLVHAVAGLVWVAVAFGHIYIGTLGTEGSLEAMTTGRVSVEWAKQHHDQWYEEVKHTAEDTDKASAAPAGNKTQTTS